MAYYAVPMSGSAISAFRHHMIERWHGALMRRSQRRRLTWTRMKTIADRYLPFPRILHPGPEKRFLVTIQGGIARQSPSIPGPTVFWTRWKDCRKKGPPMGTLKVPVTRHDHIRGPANAPVTLVEYGDYECPGCGAAYPIVNLVLEHFGPRLRFVFRHFPLTQVHPNAEPAAESAEFAGAHGLFWDMMTAFMKTKPA
jgi:hypothetical protein